MVNRYMMLAALVGSLVGCATAAQREAQTIKTTLVATDEQVKACSSGVNSDPAYAELALHYPLTDVRQASLAQQTDTSLANPHEIELLSERHERLAPCRKAAINGYMVAPPIGLVSMDYFARADANLLEIAKRHIGWAEYVVRAKALADGVRPQLVAAGQRVNAELNAQHQQEMAQRGARHRPFQTLCTSNKFSTKISR